MKVAFGNKFIEIPTRDSIAFERVKFIIKERCVGRKWVPEYKYWHVPANKNNFLALEKLLDDKTRKSLANIFLGSEQRVDKIKFLREYQNETVKGIINGKKLICLPTGSGKTICALAYMDVMKVRRALFVVPSPLKKQWSREVKTFFPNLNPVILEGTPKKRKEILKNAGGDVLLITSYETARVTPDLKRMHFDYMCLDEAHKIKNSKTKTYKTLKGIKADTITLLTATPMVNKPTEIFNIVNFAHPSFFDYYSFQDKYVIFDEVWTGSGYVQTPIAYKNLDVLHDELKPVMVFKRKEDILSELPEKTTKYYWIDPSTEQKRLMKLYASIGEETAVSDNGNEYKKLLACLTMMRRVADSPGLLLKSSSDLATIPKDTKAPKIKVLIEDILPDLDGKTIIFTEYADMADVLHKELKDFKPMIVKGGMDFQKVIDDFKNSKDQSVLISTDVLNFGVNLQFCSNVVHYDLPWSPAKITQREGRIHRIGQNNKTLFISLITKETVEERVFSLLKDKKELFSATVAGGQAIEKEIIQQVFKTNGKGN